ncbi:MAG: biopolymer transporter ExbD [Tannerellaceae bacterium]|jgi:biopolymer transport protein ExbD|nr:biopolymer transporter ExbD [Tannerellaceae bacterium]
MSLKRRNRINANFSMASMTDIIFLLLIFFMITSTVVMPNAIPLSLPQASRQTAIKPPVRVTINRQLQYYIGTGREKDQRVMPAEIIPRLKSISAGDPKMTVALYADEAIPYSEVVRVIDILQENKLKMVLVTRTK